MQTITLTRDQVALVDDEDFERLSQHSWYASEHRGRWCAQRFVGPRGQRRCIKLHHAVLEVESHVFIDHINGDALDNRRENLRVCTHAENQRNQRRRRGNLTGFKGVTRRSSGRLQKPFAAVVHVDGRGIHLGYFATGEEAARAYDAAARVHHGEFARLNFPEEAR